MFGKLADVVNGILGGGSESEETPVPVEAEDPWRDLETESGEGVQRFSGTLVLPEGTFAARKLDQNGDLEFSAQFEVVEGGPIDVYLVPDHFVEGYSTGGTFASDGDCSVEGRTEADVEATLTESDNGEHHVIFDNTARGATDTSGEVRVDVDVSATH